MPKRRLKRHLVTQPLNESYRLIPLTRNQNAIVDAADFEWLSQWNWCSLWSKHTKSFYAVRTENEKMIYMHRIILDCAKGEEADHKDHNTIDNRRNNLRKGTSGQNRCNQGATKRCISGFRGVGFLKGRITNPFIATVHFNKRRIYIGVFATAEEAAKARDKVAKKMHGEFVHLNFPTV